MKNYKNLDEIAEDWPNIPDNERSALPFFGKPMFDTCSVFSWDNRRFVDQHGNIQYRCRLCGEAPFICGHGVDIGIK